MNGVKEVKISSDEEEINKALADGFEIYGEPILADKMWRSYSSNGMNELFEKVCVIHLVLYKYE